MHSQHIVPCCYYDLYYKWEVSLTTANIVIQTVNWLCLIICIYTGYL